MRWWIAPLLSGAVALAAAPPTVPNRTSDKDRLLTPVHVEARGRPVDVERQGHAAPFVGDLDGDGLPDLLVGQFDEGRLRIYRNVGTRKKPKFDSFDWFKAGGKIASVPVG
jgi:hypothetical protein